MLCYQIYKSTSAKKKQKPILVNTGTNTLNMANVATNTMTTKELLAPLASMEDLSVCMTPMSTPGASPRTRARWSQRSSSRHVFTNFPNTNLRSFSTKYKGSSTTKWMKLNYYRVFVMQVKFCLRVILKSWGRIILGTALLWKIESAHSIQPYKNHHQFKKNSLSFF